MIDIRFPNITGTTEREQLIQVKSYLHQLAEQLQWALQNVDTNNNTSVVMPTARSLAPSSGNANGEIDVQATFASIKSLIIKSADIVNAYSEEIGLHLDGQYVAQSGFRTFVEETNATIDANSKGIKQTYTDIQAIYDPQIKDTNDALESAKAEIDKDVEGVKKLADAAESYIKETKATIKTGKLEDGVFGLEIGQMDRENGETIRRYARFTANRLSFYDKNNAEVAYISDNKLYITHAEITGTLKLGGYLIETSNGMAFKWAGGN